MRQPASSPSGSSTGKLQDATAAPPHLHDFDPVKAQAIPGPPPQGQAQTQAISTPSPPAMPPSTGAVTASGSPVTDFDPVEKTSQAAQNIPAPAASLTPIGTSAGVAGSSPANDFDPVKTHQ